MGGGSIYEVIHGKMTFICFNVNMDEGFIPMIHHCIYSDIQIGRRRNIQ